MSTKHVLLGAFVLYLILMAAGGAAYYAVLQKPAMERGTAAEPGENGQQARNESEDAKRMEAEKKAEEKKREEAEKKAREVERARKWEESRKREERMEELTAGMRVITRGGVTYYTYPHDEQMSGIYLRPFIAEREGEIVLKNDVYYYSSLEDENYGWLRADRLDVDADGYVTTLAFDPSKRRDRLGKGAESVTENYVTNADAVTIQMLKAVGNASHVTLHFYQAGTGGAVWPLGREDIRRVRDMVALYELMQAEAKGE